MFKSDSEGGERRLATSGSSNSGVEPMSVDSILPPVNSNNINSEVKDHDRFTLDKENRSTTANHTSSTTSMTTTTPNTVLNNNNIISLPSSQESELSKSAADAFSKSSLSRVNSH